MNYVDYLKKVLRDWRAFCDSYKKIERSIENLIHENAILKAENELLRKQVFNNKEVSK